MTIVEVDMDVGFWHGSQFWSKDTDGNTVRLTKKEYDQMMVNGEVIELDD